VKTSKHFGSRRQPFFQLATIFCHHLLLLRPSVLPLGLCDSLLNLQIAHCIALEASRKTLPAVTAVLFRKFAVPYLCNALSTLGIEPWVSCITTEAIDIYPGIALVLTKHVVRQNNPSKRQPAGCYLLHV